MGSGHLGFSQPRPAPAGTWEGPEEWLVLGFFSGLCQTPPCLLPAHWLGPFPEFLLGSGLSSCGVALGRPPPLPSIGRWRRPWGDGEGTGPDPQQLVPDLGCRSGSWRQGGGILRAKCRQAGVLTLEGPTGGGGGDWSPLTGSGHPLSRGALPTLLRPAWETCVRDGIEAGVKLSWDSIPDACFRLQPRGSEGARTPGTAGPLMSPPARPRAVRVPETLGDSGAPDIPSCPQLRR